MISKHFANENDTMKTKKAYRQASCLIKVKYANYQLAEDERLRMFESIGSVLQVYKCQFCAGYHIGHKKGLLHNERLEAMVKQTTLGMYMRTPDRIPTGDIDTVEHASHLARKKKHPVKMYSEKKLLNREYRKQEMELGEEEGGDYRGE